MSLRQYDYNKMENTIQNEFTVITYNIDSKSAFPEERLINFIKQIKEIKPDILGIQEGTKTIFSKLFLAMKNMGYERKLLEGDTGEVIFSKFPIKKAEFLPYQYTQQHRGLSLYLLDIHGQDIWIGNTQLESGSQRTPYLRKQISQIDKKCSRIPEHIVLMGDFQLVSYQKDIREPNNFFDAWYEAGKSSEFYTVDCKFNIATEFRDRPDRIWYRSSNDPTSKTIDCVEFRLIGVPNSNDGAFLASNHFGIWTKFLVV